MKQAHRIQAAASLLIVICMLCLANVQAQDSTIQFSPADEQGRFVHLIEFAEPGMLSAASRAAGERFDANSPAVLAQRDFLKTRQAERVRDMAAAIGRPPEVSHYYLVSHSGLATRLTPEEAEMVRALPGVTSVQRERVHELSTYRGPTFIGTDTIWDGSAVPGGVDFRGDGLVAAILDTGIPANSGAHASFANDPNCGHGQDGVPDKVLSMLDCGSTDVDGLCNGANPGDTNGHGSHTASTVAGNLIDETASPGPDIPGDFTAMSGVAHCAHIRAYKVCPTNTCPEAAIQAGMDSVLLQLDEELPIVAMNFSISGGADPWTDNDRRKLDIVDAGVFVATSAGNTGPNIPDPVGQVNHRGPWVMSVAASTRDTDQSGGAVQGDVLGGFSLRGPTPAPLQDLQKPDISAPGVRIYAAVPNGYAFISGTSMSSPHVAGAGLLMAQVHPDWTPSEIKSALQMTAFTGGFKENGSTPWDADDVGSGRADLTKAALAGLVMDETTANYLAANPSGGTLDVKDLNLAAVRNRDCSPNCSWTRTVRNTLDVAADWTASGNAITPGFLIRIDPPSFNIAPGATRDITITAQPFTDLTGALAFGEVVLSESGGLSPDLHITVAIEGEGDPLNATIVPDPNPLDVALQPGQSIVETSNIGNLGQEQALDWSIEEAGVAGGCDTPTDIPWLSVSPDDGTTPPADSMPVEVTLDAESLAIGLHRALLCIASNDTVNPRVAVPVNLTVEPPAPVADITPELFSFEVMQGDSAVDTLNIGNLGTVDLDWSAATDVPAAGRAGHDPELDEVLALPDFALEAPAQGGEPLSFTVPTGLANRGRVTGFSFSGTASGISGEPVRASFTCLVAQSPDGASFAVGGISGTYPGCTEHTWDFDGSASTNDGTYLSNHETVFDPVTGDVGEWTFTFLNDWDSTASTAITWSEVTITLHKTPLPICDGMAEVPWLAVSPAGGVTGPDATDPVEISVDAANLSPGIFEAGLCITTNDENVPMIPLPVALTVTEAPAGVLEADETALSFGEVPPGGSRTMSLTVTNTGLPGPTIVALSGIELVAGPVFEVTGGSCEAGETVLFAGASCTVEVRFSPDGLEPAGGVIIVDTEDGQTATVQVTGSGGEPTDEVFIDRFEN